MYTNDSMWLLTIIAVILTIILIEWSNISNNDMTIYEQELKLKDKLKEELIYINQNNLKRVVAQYEEYTDNLLDNHFNKRVQEIRQLEMKKNSIESKKN